jgi:hypothetical protein
VLEVHEGAVRPEPLPQLVARHDRAGAGDQQLLRASPFISSRVGSCNANVMAAPMRPHRARGGGGAAADSSE